MSRLSLQQATKDMPMSTARKPRGQHRGPDKRQISESEKNKWLFMRKTQLLSLAEWDSPEAYDFLPKAKKIVGNEAAQLVWSYATLLQNKFLVHPFTKSIYCYYFQYSLTQEGERRNNLAKKFARECMIPITYHNSQCYVETEMVLDYGDVPFILIHCLDESTVHVPIILYKTRGAGLKSVSHARGIKTNQVDNLCEINYRRAQRNSSEEYTKQQLTEDLSAITETLGNSVSNPDEVWRLLHDRPLQNSYLKINYQWFGESSQEREQHRVQYHWAWNNEPIPIPSLSERHTKTSLSLNQMPASVSEKVHVSKRTHGSIPNKSQLNNGEVIFARNADTRAFSGGSRWGSPMRRSKN